MYKIVSVVDSDLDIDYSTLIHAYPYSSTQYIVMLEDDAEVRSTWIDATEADWNNSQPKPTLEQVKQDKIAQLQRSYYASFTTFTSSALGSVHTYPIDAEARDNLRDLQNRLIADPNKDSFYFKTIEDGTLVNHTRAQFLTLLQDAETFKVQQTQHYDSKVAAVNAATDVATVNGITW